MIGNQVIFDIEKSRNIHCKHGFEWALYVRFVDQGRWTIWTWDKRPSEIDVDNTKQLVLRSFEFYHRHLRIPPFRLEEA